MVKTNVDWTAKILGMFIVLLVPSVGILLLLNPTLFEGAFEFGIIMILVWPLVIAGNILMYRGKV